MAAHRDSPHFEYWKMLKSGYDHFELTRTPPKVDVCERKYIFNQIPEERRRVARGIEVGQIFYFGTKYSEPMGATVVGPDGARVPVHMGSHGIGVSRLLGAIIEASHDDKGIIWPEGVTPFHAGIVNLKQGDASTDSACEALERELATRLDQQSEGLASSRPGELDAADELRQLRGRHLGGVDADVLGVQPLGDFAHHPVGGQLGLAAGLGRRLEVGAEGLALGHHRRVIGRQAVLLLEALRHGARQLGHRGLDALHPLRRDDQRRQVRVGEVAIVHRLFLGPHRAGLAFGRVEQARLLIDRAAVLDHRDLQRRSGDAR